MRQTAETRGVIVQQRPLKGAWGMTALIFLFMLINFADKIVVGLAAKPIMEELKLSPRISGSWWARRSSSCRRSRPWLVGFVANRFQTRHALLVMALVWALVQLPMLVSASLWVLVACRIVFGIADGPSSPIATDALYKWFPDSLRGMPTAIVAQGSAFGVILAVPTLNWLIVEHSWHWAFGALAVAGMAWVVLWLVFGREGTLVDPPVGRARRRRRAHSLALPDLLPQHRRGVLRGLRLLLGPGARPHLVHRLPGRRAGLQPDDGGRSQHAALDLRHGGRCWWAG